MSNILEMDERDGTTIITLQETKLYQSAVDVFHETMVSLLEKKDEKHGILIDLSRVEIMNSSGLGVLILTRDGLNRIDGKLVIVGLKPFMAELFKRMRLDLLFTIADTVDEGLAMLREV